MKANKCKAVIDPYTQRLMFRCVAEKDGECKYQSEWTPNYGGTCRSSKHGGIRCDCRAAITSTLHELKGTIDELIQALEKDGNGK